MFKVPCFFNCCTVYVLLSEVTKLAEDAFRNKVDFVREQAASHGREITVSTTGFMTILTETEEQGDQMAEAVASGFGLEPAIARKMPMSLVGTPEQWIEELKRREREWGLGHMVLSGGMDARTLERFGKEVEGRRFFLSLTRRGTATA